MSSVMVEYDDERKYACVSTKAKCALRGRLMKIEENDKGELEYVGEDYSVVLRGVMREGPNLFTLYMKNFRVGFGAYHKFEQINPPSKQAGVRQKYRIKWEIDYISISDEFLPQINDDVRKVIVNRVLDFLWKHDGTARDSENIVVDVNFSSRSKYWVQFLGN